MSKGRLRAGRCAAARNGRAVPAVLALAALFGSPDGVRAQARPAATQPVTPVPATAPAQAAGPGTLLSAALKLMNRDPVEADGPDAAGEPPLAEKIDETTVRRSATGMLDLNVRNTPLSTVLEMLSHQGRVNIVSTPAVTGSISANLYGVTLETALDAILIPSGLTHRKLKNIIYVGTAEELDKHHSAPETRALQLKYMTKADARAAVTGMLSAVGKIAEGGPDTGGVQGGGSAGTSGLQGFGDAGPEYLIVTDYPDRLKAIEALVRSLDVRPQQVLIEATILRATLNEDNQLGVDLTLLSGVDFENVTSISDPASTNIQVGALPPNQFQETTFNANTSMLNGFPSGGFTFGIIKNNVGAFIRALEDTTDVTVLANPKVIALNRHEAEVIVGRRDGYLTTTVTETAAVQSVDFLETGTQIRLRPIINADGTVRLDVQPKDSNGGLTSNNLPFEETTEATAQLLIEDGHTVLIGGLFRERTVSTHSQVPGIGNIPLLGDAFKRTRDQTVREEVIILLTVHVLKGSAEEAGQFEAMVRDAERVRVGSRRGLMATGRERLSQAFYREALRQYELGDYDGALLNLRMSLHNDPRRPAALKLLEELEGRQVWESDTSRVRTKVFELLEAGRPDPVEGLDRLNRPEVHAELLRGDGGYGHAAEGDQP